MGYGIIYGLGIIKKRKEERMDADSLLNVFLLTMVGFLTLFLGVEILEKFNKNLSFITLLVSMVSFSVGFILIVFIVRVILFLLSPEPGKRVLNFKQNKYPLPLSLLV